MRKTNYNQRQDRVLNPRTITTNRKKFCGLLLAGFFIFTVVFGASAWGVEHDGGDAGSSSYYQQELGKKGIGAGIVGATGIMTYSYPMGDAGISYESSSGTWAVAGFGAITRDTTRGVPSYDYTKDTFLLNGEKLVYESSGTDVRYYHTERESYLKISYHFPGNTSSSYWMVKAKDGTQSYYGNSFYGGTTNSRISAVRTGGGVRCWALGESFSVNNKSLTTYYYDADSTHGDFYLTKIISGKINASKFKTTYLYYDYHGGGGYTFLYSYLNYRQGAKVKINRKRLKSVLVKMGTDSSGSGGYNHSAFKLEWSESIKNENLLDAVTQYGSNVAFDGTGDVNPYLPYDITSGDHFPATEFDYSDPNFELSSTPEDWGSTHNYALKAIKSSDGRSYTGLMDMNGDGMADLVEKVGDFEIYFSTGAGFSSVNNWGDPFDRWLRESIAEHTICDLIDMNGDGLPDRVYHSYYEDEYRIKMNNGSGFPTYKDWDIPNWGLHIRNTDSSGNITSELIDMNGDGLVDIVEKRSGESFKIYLGTGGNFKSTPESWENANPYGKALRQFEVESSNTHTISDLMDINGDGLPDRLYRESTIGHLKVRYNTGIGFTSSEENWYGGLSAIRKTDSDHNGLCDIIDMNGDGLPDRLHKDSDGNLIVALNSHGGFNAEISFGNPCNKHIRETDDGHIVSDFADMNGDGLLDRVVKTGTGNFQVWLNQSSSRHTVLTEIINPHGGKTTYTYRAVDKSENPDMKIPLWVVNAVTVNDGGIGRYSVSSTGYQYSGGKYVNVVGKREFRGFEKVVITDPADNKTETHYHQDDVLKGLVKKSITRGSDGRIYDYVYNTYVDHCAGSNHSTHYGYGISGVHAPLLTRVDTYVVDGSTQTDNGASPGGGTYKHIRKEISYDDPDSSTAKEYGDPYEIENLGDLNNANDQTRTFFKYAVDTACWVVLPWYKKVEGTNGQNNTYFTQAEEKYYYDGSSAGHETDLDNWLSEGNVDEGILKRVSKNTGSYWINAKRLGYDSYGNATEVKNANNATTTTLYDTQYHMFPVKTTMPTVSGGTFKSYNYYDYYTETTDTDTISNNIKHGRPSMVRDINGQYTKTYYDNLGRVTDVRIPGDDSGDPTIHYDYHFYTSSNDPSYVKTTLKDGNGGLESYTYTDGLGRTVQIKKEAIEGDSSATKWATVNTWSYYHAEDYIYTALETSAPYFSTTSSFNRPTSPEGGRTKTESYCGGSDYGKITKVTAPDGTISYTYSARLVTTTRNARNFGGTSTVDGLGNVVEVKTYSDSHPFETCYRTDKMYYNTGTGQLVKKIENYGTGKNNVTKTMTYDMIGRNTSTTDPDLGTWKYYYDEYYGYSSSGNLIVKEDAKGNETMLEYDQLNRVTKKTYPGSGNYIDYIYDYHSIFDTGTGLAPLGHLVRVKQYKSGSEVLENAYKYDNCGRSVGEYVEFDNMKGYLTMYSHDSMDRIDTITYPDGEVVKHTYLADGNLDELGTTDDTAKYIDAIHYDALGRMTLLEYQNGTNNAHTRYSYYGSNGNYRLKNIYVKEGDDSPREISNYEFDYDALGNIIRIDGGNNNDYTGAHDQVFTYDHLNRLTAQTNANYAGLNQEQHYVYDAIDRILSKTGVGDYSYSGANAGPHAVTGAAGSTYSYDANGNMSSGGGNSYTYDSANHLVEVSGSENSQYSYDSAGNRVKKVENGVTTYYINGYYEIEDRTPIKYYYANGQRIAKNDNGTLSFYHTDHLGGSARITDSSGTEQYSLGYKPYGSHAYSSGSGDEPIYKFTGKEEDSTGLYYYGARYYDPNLARFISPDNYGDNYVYCNNNPLKYVDPDGNRPYSFQEQYPHSVMPRFQVLRGTHQTLEKAHVYDIMLLLAPLPFSTKAVIINRAIRKPVGTKAYEIATKLGISKKKAGRVAEVVGNAAEGTVWGVPASIIGQYRATGKVDKETLAYDVIGFTVFGGMLGGTKPYTTKGIMKGYQGTIKGRIWDATLGTGSYYPACLISGYARGYTPMESTAIYIKSRPMWFGQNLLAPPGSPMFQPTVFGMRWIQKVIEGGGTDPNDYFWNALGGYPLESNMPGGSSSGSSRLGNYPDLTSKTPEGRAYEEKYPGLSGGG